VHQHQHASGCGVLLASHDEELVRTWCDEVVRW
jgi:peptide/nickel transport system ATP-binding protein